MSTHYKAMSLTQEQGLAIQAEQLQRAKRLYKADVYNALVAHCKKQNAKLRMPDDGYQVFRGTDISNFCENYANNPEQ